MLGVLQGRPIFFARLSGTRVMAVPRLPDEVWRLVLAHLAAMRVQRVWRRWSRFGHAARWHRWWSAIRHHMGEARWRALVPYAHVRREWRREAPSWVLSEDLDLDCIVKEARQGLWGARWAWLTV